MEYPMTSHPTKRRRNGKKRSCGWHIRVWIETHGDTPDGYVVHHINGDKSDYRIENLECLSRKEHGNKHKKKLYLK